MVACAVVVLTAVTGAPLCLGSQLRYHVKIRRYFTTSANVVLAVTNANVVSQHALFSL